MKPLNQNKMNKKEREKEILSYQRAWFWGGNKEQYDLTFLKLIKRLFFGKPLYMNVYQDSNGNKYGGTIFTDKNTSVIDHVNYIDKPKHLGVIEIY